ncbi:DUF2127 domain-containing protein [Mesorhizobium sp. B4-1-3]|uniref:DUF2127 domain-containing protein n=1 Tax=Mesorhizobium sp. B4-1-3 TaxID=2589889 RepID=UPI00112D6585|nr:DUF2127 domain-containing protein [Mesorhizobium sp. B4-1-3]TPI11970.1 DUF2127 domain-containing protein [Mesorhizobium sp. B4-1-3]
MKPASEHRIHQLFEVGVWLKGAHALIECVSGVLLYLITTETIASWVNMFTQDELIEDPTDFIAAHLSRMAAEFSLASKQFYAFYLLSHGLIKLLLVIGLLRGKLWSYPASLVALGAFMAYQIYRYSYTHSPGLLVLTVFDAIVMWLIWREWKTVRRHIAP